MKKLIFIFERPEYEKKSLLWKLWYRSGKETVDAGRTYAENWLKELQ